MTPKDIIEYWFSPRIKKHWFASTPELDREIHEQFAEIWHEASKSQLDVWSETPEGCLALVIILDQFPLNMFRGTAKSFSTESKAREIARQAITRGFDKDIKTEQLSFLYMPFMHSENETDQEYSVKLYQEANLENNVRFAEHHQAEEWHGLGVAKWTSMSILPSPIVPQIFAQVRPVSTLPRKLGNRSPQ